MVTQENIGTFFLLSKTPLFLMNIYNDYRYQIHTHSYMALRKAVGIIGIALPFTLMLGVSTIFGTDVLQDSISHYYYTGMRDVFVGSLCAVALFMFFYAGYDKTDEWLSNFAGLFALGVAWFPTTEKGAIDVIGIIHFGSASALFIAFAIFSLFLFTKSKEGVKPTPQKVKRNKIYRICGVVILLSILAMFLYSIFIEDSYYIPRFIFWGETIALIAFGISWLVKGEAILADN